VLDRIVATKAVEVARLQPRRAELRAAAESAPVRADFEAALRRGSNVTLIAEVKRRSPSAGAIDAAATAADVARRYADAGVACISVLTDEEYFGGALQDLRDVADAVATPLLRKDFTIDDVQVYEARAAGASAVLLIARILDDVRLAALHALAHELQLAALVEVHDEAEVERALRAGARIIGVNNRDLATFTTDLERTVRLAGRVPAEVVLVGESGIRTAADVQQLADAGVTSVLVGEALMRAADAGAAARALGSVARRAR